MAFIAEPVVGATAGCVPPVEGYFTRIREICDEFGVLLILDEVMAGCGRSGTYFAFEQDGVRPDMVTIAKGLGGGYQAVGATIVQGFVHDGIVEGFGSFEHGHTYIGHATACATALAVAGVIDEQDLLARVRDRSDLLFAELGRAFAEHPNVGDIRGRGLLVGVELVADREARTPAAATVAARIKDEAMAQGLIIYPGGGTADGTAGAHILLAPPFIYSEAHVDELVGKLVTVLDKVTIEA
jgi:adenosylmethionine-8-amino-7-oxononanoate aminotransferase